MVTDWQGDASTASDLSNGALEVLDYSGVIHKALQGLEGAHFGRFDLAETHTNHNHEDIVENIEIYKCVAERML